MPYTVIDSALAQAAPVTTIGEPLTSEGETLATMRAELRAAVNRPELDAAVADKFINRSYIALCAELDLDVLNGSMGFNTVANQHLYLLPGAVSHIKNVASADTVNYPLNGGRPFTKIDLDKYRRLEYLVDEPSAFFRVSGGSWLEQMIVFWPTPKAIRPLAIDFRIRPLDLTLDTDSPILPPEFHESLIAGAVQRAFRNAREFDKAAVMRNEQTAEVRGKLDPVAGEDDNRIILSSIPRRRSDLITDKGHYPESYGQEDI